MGYFGQAGKLSFMLLLLEIKAQKMPDEAIEYRKKAHNAPFLLASAMQSGSSLLFFRDNGENPYFVAQKRFFCPLNDNLPYRRLS